MLRTHCQFALVLTVAVSLWAPGLSSQTTKPAQPKQTSGKKKHSVDKKTAVKAKLDDVLPDPALQPPPPPPTPEQMPAIAPNVTYQSGLLTIVARNSVLSDILRAVRAQTGAQIDIPPNATERVVAQVGPGPARDVLAKLLNGTHFNYVMLGSASNPNTLAQVILTPSQNGPEPGPVQATGQPGMPMQPGQPYANQPYPGQPNPGQPNPNQPYPQQGMQVQNPGDQGGGEGMDQDAQDNVDNNAPEDGAPEQANGEENQQNPNQPQVKTPEQLLQELQRQQQIQQQQQQGQPGEGQQPQPQAQPQIVVPNPQQYPPQQPQPQQPPQQQEEPR